MSKVDIDKFLCDIRKYRLDDELGNRIKDARSGAAAVSSTLTFLYKAMNYAFEQQGLRYDGNSLVEIEPKKQGPVKPFPKDEEWPQEQLPNFKIETGKWYMCIKDVIMQPGGDVAYKKGVFYKSENDGCVTNELGNSHHRWSEDKERGGYKEYFRPATEEEVVKLQKPKFKVGDFAVNEHGYVRQIVAVTDYAYRCIRQECCDSMLNPWEGVIKYVDTYWHRWTINDAKDGDVLNSVRVQATVIFKGFADDGKHILAYCALQKGLLIKQEMLWDMDFDPSPEEWKAALFSKMKEEGYRWNAEKKELEKIPHDFELTDLECERIRRYIIEFIKMNSGINLPPDDADRMLAWLEKQADQKQEWSDEDRRKLSRIYSVLRQAADTHAFSTTCRLIGDKECIELQDFLRSIIPQQRQERIEWWKPSEEQMQTLLLCEAVLKVGGQAELGDKLGEIYEQLKNLTE